MNNSYEKAKPVKTNSRVPRKESLLDKQRRTGTLGLTGRVQIKQCRTPMPRDDHRQELKRIGYTDTLRKKRSERNSVVQAYRRATTAESTHGRERGYNVSINVT